MIIRTRNENQLTIPHYFVINHNSSANALGRSISLAIVAREHGMVELLSFGRGDLWKGASQFDIPVTQIGRDWKRDIRTRLDSLPVSDVVFWLSKGLRPLDKLAEFIHSEFPTARIVLDLDDDDAGLAETFIRTSLSNKIKLNILRRGHPWRIRQSQTKIAKLADAFTFSTDALRHAFPSQWKPSARIPHVRPLTPVVATVRRPSETSEGVYFGCFGTIRPHKGGGILLDVMRADRSMELVTFRNCGLGNPRPEDHNWTEIDPDTPLDEAYRMIDVAIIPITDSGSGAQYQLPAKLVDAMRTATPIIATQTPAIREIASGVTRDLPPDISTSELIEEVRSCARDDEGARAEERYLKLLTPESVAKVMQELLKNIAGTRYGCS